MSKKAKISLAIFIVVLIGLGTYAFSIYRQRSEVPSDTQKTEDTTTSSSQTSTDQSPVGESPNSAVDENWQSDEPEEILDEDSTQTEEGNNYLDISKTDCNNNCKNFTDDEDLKYCKEICGISGEKKDVKNKSGCDALEDLEKDYCLKDLAISTKNIATCTEINDTNVQKTCKNRLAQDLLESQNQ